MAFKPRRRIRNYTGRHSRHAKRIITVILLLIGLAAACVYAYYVSPSFADWVQTNLGIQLPAAVTASPTPEPTAVPIATATPKPVPATSTPTPTPAPVRTDVSVLELTAEQAADPYAVPALCRTSGATAVAVELKGNDGYLTYASQLPDYLAGLSRQEPLFDLAELVRICHENDIYVIGRLCCLQDDRAARQMPAAAIQHLQGVTWLDWNYGRWLNPYAERTAEYLSALIGEAAGLELDEISLNTLSFPVDGKTNLILWGDEAAADPAEGIAQLLKRLLGTARESGIALSLELDLRGMFDPTYAATGGTCPDLSDLGSDLASVSFTLLPSLMTPGRSILDHALTAEETGSPLLTAQTVSALVAQRYGVAEEQLRLILPTDACRYYDYFRGQSPEDLAAGMELLRAAGFRSCLVRDPAGSYPPALFS